MTRERLDLLLVTRGLAPTRERAQALILAGRVRAGGTVRDKPGTRVPADVALEVAAGPRRVGRGAEKLAPVLVRFGRVPGRGCALDVGASTGGFTEVLLEAGYAPVLALDVGRGLLDWSLRRDPRVVVLEAINARYLAPARLPCAPGLATVDVSFISLRLVLPAVASCLAPGGTIVALVKPQFEVGRAEVGRGGIVRDPALHARALGEVAAFAVAAGWGVADACASPLRGAKGNREFFLHLSPTAAGLGRQALAAVLEAAVAGEGPAR